MFFLHNVFKMFVLFSGFGLGHSVVGHQARDLGQDLGAMQLVISVESVSVERIVYGRANRFWSGIRSRSRATRIGLCRIDDLKRKSNWIGQFILNKNVCQI